MESRQERAAIFLDRDGGSGETRALLARSWGGFRVRPNNRFQFGAAYPGSTARVVNAESVLLTVLANCVRAEVGDLF